MFSFGLALYFELIKYHHGGIGLALAHIKTENIETIVYLR